MASAAPVPKRHKLVGHSNFKRSNPLSDRFGIQRFHHIEFWCAPARIASLTSLFTSLFQTFSGV
jgi:hypothetical protein